MAATLRMLNVVAACAAMGCAAAEGRGCGSAVRPFLSTVKTPGLHVVCILGEQTPGSAATDDAPMAHVYVDSVAAAKLAYRLRNATASDGVVQQLLGRLAQRGGALPLLQHEYRSVALFSIHGQPILRDAQLFHGAPRTIFFAFDGGRWTWPPIRIGHVWRTTHMGKPLELRTLSLRPAVFEMKGFLTQPEAEHIRSLASPHLARAGLQYTDGTGEETADVRTSTNTFISRGDTAMIAQLEKRVHAVTCTHDDEGEEIQVCKHAHASLIKQPFLRYGRPIKVPEMNAYLLGSTAVPGLPVLMYAHVGMWT